MINFRRYFGELVICTIREDWFEHRLRSYFPRKGDAFHRGLHLVINETTQIDIHAQKILP